MYSRALLLTKSKFNYFQDLLSLKNWVIHCKNNAIA